MYALYIHIPFCKQKCLYCDFASISGSENLIPTYLQSLYRDMENYSGTAVSTIYVGGGTPSLLSSEQIKDLFNRIRSNFVCSRLSEVTVEANPESVDEDILRALKVSGVNRLSIGVQSFNNDELSFLGRIHSSECFYNAFESARKLEFNNINLDLIYGLPDQSMEDWQKNLKTVVLCNPEHISVYPLTIEKGTPFFNKKISTDDENQAMMYEWSLGFLESAGYEHYEISNWAKPGFKCKHNMTYWESREYIGVGSAAASYINGCRKKNIDDVRKYITLLSTGRNPAQEEDYLDDEKRLGEEIILKLRCRSGVELSPSIYLRYGAAIEQLIDQQLLEKAGENIKLTKRGLLLASHVMREFV